MLLPKPISLPITKLYPFVNIKYQERKQFVLWFNIDASTNNLEIEDLPPDSVIVTEETSHPPSFTARIIIQSIIKIPGSRNEFRVELGQESKLLRFSFDIENINLKNGVSIAEYAAKENISFMGQDGKNIVTAFIRLEIG